jgi:large subunit ribosomal protein L10
MAIRAKKVQSYKVDAVKELKDKIQGSADFIFTEYRGLTVEQISTLRKTLREKQAEFHVVKNNFARIAFTELSYPDNAELFAGPTAIAFAKTDSNEVAKAIVDFSKETAVRVKGAYVDKAFMDKAAAEAYSKLPSRNQLIAMFMSGLRSPVQKLAYLLVALQEKLEKGGAAPAPEAPAAEAAPEAPAAEAPAAEAPQA